MPSNDERRKVAARLREEAERHCEGFDSLTLMGVLRIDLEAEPFFDGFRRYHDLATFETWNRLADLIEPEPERTCRLNEFEGIYGCSECGQIAHVFTRPNFCPNCGARVRKGEQ